MPQVKRFQAKKDLRLDYGHTIKADESFVVTSLYCCEQDAQRSLVILGTGRKAAVSKLEEVGLETGSNPKPVESK